MATRRTVSAHAEGDRGAERRACGGGGGGPLSQSRTDGCRRGVLLSFGDGAFGRLGHGDDTVTVVAGRFNNLVALQSGRVFGWGYGHDESLELQLTPLEYPSLRVALD